MTGTETQRLGIVQQKGGVAKTTDTINLAGAAASVDANVLVVDADPQGYLTHRLGLDEHYRARSPTLFEAFEEPESGAIDDLIASHEEFDVIPSNVDMFRLEQSLIASGMKPRARLNKYLNRVEKEAETDYDFIFIDAPPSLGPINDNVLIASENILVPCEMDKTTVLALNHLSNQISTLEEHYDIDITTHGLVLSNAAHPLNNDQRDQLHGIARKYRDVYPIYEIRARAAIKQAMNAGSSVFGYPASCDQEWVHLRIISDLTEATDTKKVVA